MPGLIALILYAIQVPHLHDGRGDADFGKANHLLGIFFDFLVNRSESCGSSGGWN